MPRRPKNEDSDATRAKLLEAASLVFAELGFRAATVREICARAGTNVASVNYHFGDKLGLYTEVLKDSSAPEVQNRIRSAISGASSTEEQLSIFVRGMFDKILGSNRPAHRLKIMLQEMANPTPALAIVVDEVIRPQYNQLCKVISLEIGMSPKSTATRLCVHSLIGQVAHYMHARAVMSQLWPQFQMDAEQADEVARHIVRFTLAGLASAKFASEDKKKVTRHERPTNYRQSAEGQGKSAGKT
ncbi:MAG TPA: CerR family C-terminal domain-containing protein [Bryobacteraceae bacterium]|nr:CerR family C-terminal domain-containing protein [Bryobacteraceae bacterium]